MSLCYIGIAPCGCVRAAMSGDPELRREAAKFCADIVRDGLRLERMETEKVRAASWHCPECEPALSQIGLGL